MDSRLYMDLPSSMHDALRELAKVNERTSAAEARRAIVTHLAAEGMPLNAQAPGIPTERSQDHGVVSPHVQG